MDKYHGTPMGGTLIDIQRFFQGSNRGGLLPFSRPDQLPTVMKYAASFILDNGAYSLRNTGVEVDYDAYVAWVESVYRHPGFRFAIIPDKMGGTEEENDALLARWPKHLPGVPVFHMTQSLERLARLVAEWPMIALGGNDAYGGMKSKQWWARMDEMMRVICDEKGRPKVRIHGLKMLDRKVFKRLPLASGDSANAARNSILDADDTDDSPYPVVTRFQKADAIAKRIENAQSADHYKFQARQVALFETDLFHNG